MKHPRRLQRQPVKVANRNRFVVKDGQNGGDRA
jgi:hypothetical protein